MQRVQRPPHPVPRERNWSGLRWFENPATPRCGWVGRQGTKDPATLRSCRRIWVAESRETPAARTSRADPGRWTDRPVAPRDSSQTTKLAMAGCERRESQDLAARPSREPMPTAQRMLSPPRGRLAADVEGEEKFSRRRAEATRRRLVYWNSYG